MPIKGYCMSVWAGVYDSIFDVPSWSANLWAARSAIRLWNGGGKDSTDIIIQYNFQTYILNTKE